MVRSHDELDGLTLDGPFNSDYTTRLLSTEEVARILVVPTSTLYGWRYKGTGPKAYRVGKHLRYRFSDVLEWLERSD